MNFPAYENLIHDSVPHLALYAPPVSPFYEKYEQATDCFEYTRQLFDLKGKILKAEVLTLFELAWYANGPVLELGCFQGASTIVLCQANPDVTTIDLSLEAIEAAQINFAKHQVKPRIIHAEAAKGIQQLAKENKKFSFVFIDHGHDYESVYYACVALSTVLSPGAYLYFHDFQDLRNETKEYGVYQAVKNTLSNKLKFIGLSGAGAIFQYEVE